MALDRDLDLYRRLYLVRRAEQVIQKCYADDEMKTPVHLSIGQEAIPVGVCAALGPEDRLFGTYRSHALYLARTLDTDGFFAELYGRETGIAGGKAGSMHLTAPAEGLMATSAVVATTLPLALGAAFTAAYRRTGARVAAFFGDGAIDEGAFWETLNFACLRGFPLLFVCEDNGLAIHSPVARRHGHAPIADVAERFRCRVYRSESTDAVEIRELAEDALQTIDRGKGPCFLHLHCYRYVEHVGVAEDRQFDLGYRDRDQFESWLDRDPVKVLRARLVAEAAGDRLAAIERDIDSRIERSLERARQAPFPSPDALHRHVFA